MLETLRFHLYTLFVTRPILFAVLDMAIPAVLGFGLGWLVFA